MASGCGGASYQGNIILNSSLTTNTHDHASESTELVRPDPSQVGFNVPLLEFLLTPTTVKTLAIRNSAEELMISRSAQLKGQDQKVTYLTDDFMRDFIAVSDPKVGSSSSSGFILSVPIESQIHARDSV